MTSVLTLSVGHGAVHFMSSACALQPRCGCHGFARPAPEAVERHEREVARRLAWCVREGRVPAHEHKHLAPGDDSQFVYGVPPWTPDGAPNPAGIYFSPEDPLLTQYGRDPDGDKGWACTRCREWVARAPRPFRGGEEPWDWWFCFGCKAKAVKPPAKRLAEAKLAAQCRKIGEMWAVWCNG